MKLGSNELSSKQGPFQPLPALPRLRDRMQFTYKREAVAMAVFLLGPPVLLLLITLLASLLRR